jgi:hypothetical protein
MECSVLVQKKRRRPSFFDNFDSFFDSNFDNFFGSYERYPLTLRSPETALVIKDIPSSGAPAGFNGAVGNYSFKLSAAPTEVRVGDPITLTMVITGEGNLKTVTQPALSLGDMVKTYEPQVTQTESSKVFEQVIVPTTTRLKEIPAVDFSFFNPDSGRFQTVRQGPVPLRIQEADRSAPAIVSGKLSGKSMPLPEAAGSDIVFIKEKPGGLQKTGSYLYRRKGFFVLWLLPLIAAALFGYIHRHRQRLATDLGYARRLRAPKKARHGLAEAERLLGEKSYAAFFDVAAKTGREYLADALHCSPAAITADTIAAKLSGKSIDAKVIKKLEVIFHQCDMARFAPLENTHAQAADFFARLRETIDYLERQKL